MIHAHRTLVILSLILFMFARFVLAASDENAAGIKGDVVAATQAWKLIGEGALLIDVRSAEEFAAGSIEGAVNIPHTHIDELAKLLGDELARPAVVFCRSGNRSGKAQQALEKRGYTAVFNGTGYTALLATRPDQEPDR